MFVAFRDGETNQTDLQRHWCDSYGPEKRDFDPILRPYGTDAFPDLSGLFIHFYSFKCFTCSLLLVARKPRDGAAAGLKTFPVRSRHFCSLVSVIGPRTFGIVNNRKFI